MQTIRYELLDAAGGKVALVTFDEAGSPVNTMCVQWQNDLVELVQQVQKDRAQLVGIVLASAKTSFFAGADLKSTMRASANDAQAGFAVIERMKQQFRTLETLGIPVVACLNGAALGGGWEVALIAHHRISLDHPRIQLGLPEVT